MDDSQKILGLISSAIVIKWCRDLLHYIAFLFGVIAQVKLREHFLEGKSKEEVEEVKDRF